MKKKFINVLAPGQDMVMSLMKAEGVKVVRDEMGYPLSISPCEVGFGYLYHGHMIPPFKPESMLILGYGMGTLAELVRKVHGYVKITGVDKAVAERTILEEKMITGDALEFVKECSNAFIKRRYDVVAIDLFENGEVPNFVFTAEFASMLTYVTKRLLCINVRSDDFHKLKNLRDYGFKFHRHVQVFDNIVSWWGI